MITRTANWVLCTGEAHSNAYIDNCMLCSPFWRQYPTCTSCGFKLKRTPKFYRCKNKACTDNGFYSIKHPDDVEPKLSGEV